MTKNSLFLITSVVMIILLIPLIAMQFTDEVNWGLFDFIIAAFMLFSTGIAIDFIIKKVKNSKMALLLSLIIFLILILIWAELAVGIF